MRANDALDFVDALGQLAIQMLGVQLLADGARETFGHFSSIHTLVKVRREHPLHVASRESTRVTSPRQLKHEMECWLGMITRRWVTSEKPHEI